MSTGSRSAACALPDSARFTTKRPPSLSIDLERGVFHCFGCGSGGGVKRFAELVGEPWGDTHSESRTAKAHRLALTAARDQYNRWQQERLVALTDRYRELLAECEIAGVGYRATRRRPDLFTEGEARHWETRLAATYDQLAPLEQDLDTLTYNRHEEERFHWWRQEADSGRLSA